MSTKSKFTSGLVAFLFAAFPLTATAETKTYAVKPDASSVGFLAVGKPGFLKIRGEGGKLVGKATITDGKLSGAFEVALGDLKTGIDLRDEHMKEKYLEVAKFPKATLTIDSLVVANGEKEYDFNGKLTVKGVEKPVSGKLNLTLAADKAEGKASFKLQTGDYPIGVPSHLGVTMAESVDVNAEFVATPL